MMSAVKESSAAPAGRGLWPHRPWEVGLAVAAVLLPAVLIAGSIWVLQSDHVAILFLVPVAVASASFGYAGLAGGVLLCGVLAQGARFAAALPPEPPDLSLAVTMVAAGALLAHLRGTHKRLLTEEANRRCQADALEAANRRLVALNGALSAVNSSLELERVLDAALDHVLALLGVGVGAIHLLHPHSGELDLAAHRGISGDFLRSIADLKVGDGFSGRVVLTGMPVLVEDADERPRLMHMVEDKQNLRSFASVPISNRDEVLGALSVVSHGDRALVQEDVDLATAVAGQLGVAVSNARLYEEVQAGLEREKALKDERVRAAQLEGAVQAVRAVQERVNSPLMVITSSAELLAKQGAELPTGMQRTLRRILRAAQEVADVGERLGRIPVPAPDPSSADEVVDQALSDPASPKKAGE